MDPTAEYTERRERYHREEQILQKRSIAIGNWRLAIGVTEAVLAWLVFGAKVVSPWSLLVPVLAFIALAVWHQRIMRSRTLAERAAAYYERGLARLRDEWPGTGIAGERHRNPEHVYAEDLDLFGKGSLFELVATTRTAAGEDTLASWLLHPAESEEVLQRQEAVDELRFCLDLREDFALLAADVPPNVNVKLLGDWGDAAPVTFPPVLSPLMALLAMGGIAAVLGFFAGRMPLWVPVAILGCDYALIFTLRAKVNQVLGNVEGGRDVKLLSALLHRLERERFESRKLKRLRAMLEAEGEPASKRIARLGRLVDWLDSSDHVLIRIVRPLILWQEQLAMAFERWRRESGAQVRVWAGAVAEFEALSSFAALAYERPHWMMPVLNQAPEAQFVAKSLRHPLLAETSAVPNDVALDNEQRMIVVSGSNMSGKSTLLRAVGLNAVLAWAGAPVAAGYLRVSELEVGASIRVNDSLQDHRSRFFAEISRLRQIVDLTKGRKAVLFLLDELLSGTNSHDRRIGAAGIVRELLRVNTVGLLTTHDLALANIQQDVNASVINMHFEDRMNGKEMVFDYKLKPGVVTRSNALELMRAVGLEV